VESVIISGESKDIQLLVTIAKKMGMDVEFIDKADFVIAKAIQEGETGEFIDTSDFLKSIN
jgi:hypothetical protein